jgi:peptidoglycan/xylan/chitin deacetylase (PgdA/CDA1 family)
MFLWPDNKVPIITYHKITDSRDGTNALWDVSPPLFLEQMDYIAHYGFNVVSLQEFYDHWQQGRELPEKSVIITFDDGYAGVYKHAYPILRRYGFPATVFLTINYIGDGRPFWWDETIIEKRPELAEEFRPLSWEEIEEMRDSGLITFGSHTMSHPRLGRLSRSKIEYELEQSKRLLEERLKQNVGFFAYPFGTKGYGDVSDVTSQILVEKGYVLACTSEIGRNSLQDDILMLKRIGITRLDSVSLTRAKLTGAYDWVGFAQRAFQRVFKYAY